MRVCLIILLFIMCIVIFNKNIQDKVIENALLIIDYAGSIIVICLSAGLLVWFIIMEFPKQVEKQEDTKPLNEKEVSEFIGHGLEDEILNLGNVKETGEKFNKVENMEISGD